MGIPLPHPRDNLPNPSLTTLLEHNVYTLSILTLFVSVALNLVLFYIFILHFLSYAQTAHFR